MAKLAANVNVGGVWYGPAHGNADKVPPAVAKEITNPDAWEDGKAPRGVQLDDPTPARPPTPSEEAKAAAGGGEGGSEPPSGDGG